MKKLVLKLLFFIVVYIVFWGDNVSAANQTASVTPNQFDEHFILSGGAKKIAQTADNVDIRLTEAIPSSPNGSFRFADYLSFDTSFSLQSAIKVGRNGNLPMADGFSFLFYQGTPDLNQAMSGQGLGMLGIPKAMGLVVDLYYNPKDDINVNYWQNASDAGDPPRTPYIQFWSTNDKGLGKREMNGLYDQVNGLVSRQWSDVNITYNADSRILQYIVNVPGIGYPLPYFYEVPKDYKYGSLLVSGSVGAAAASQDVRFKGFTYEPYRERTVEFVDSQTGAVIKTSKVSGTQNEDYSIDPVALAKSTIDGGKDITPYYTIDDPSIITGKFGGTIKDDMLIGDDGNPTGEWKKTQIKVTARPVWGDVPWDFDDKSGVLTFLTNGTLSEYKDSPWNRKDGKKINDKSIKRIIFKKSVIAPKISNNLFSSKEMGVALSNLTSIDGIELMDTSQVTDMSYLFSGLSSVVKLPIEKWDTSQVTDMSYLFLGTSSLSSLPVENWNTSKVTNMMGLFRDSSSLTSINLANWNTSKVVNMSQMFGYALSLESLDISNFNTSNVDISNMFLNANKLSNLTLGKNFRDSKFTSGLPDVTNNGIYSGQWVHKDSQKLVGQSNIFMKNYDGSLPGTYVWAQKTDVNVIVKYINKETNLPIYENIENKKQKGNDIFSFSFSKSIKENLDELISENKLKLDYEGYQPITTDDYVVVGIDGTETKPESMPKENFTLIFYYTGSIYIKDAPNISFGEVTRTLSGKTSVKPVKAGVTNDLVLVNTTDNNSWKLTASLPKGIYKKTDDMIKLQSNLIFKKPKNSGNLILNSLPNEVVTDKQLSLDPLGKVNLDASFQLDVFSKNDIGNYTGSVMWAIERVP